METHQTKRSETNASSRNIRFCVCLGFDNPTTSISHLGGSINEGTLLIFLIQVVPINTKTLLLLIEVLPTNTKTLLIFGIDARLHQWMATLTIALG
jgi:hypothetical protein